MTACGEMSAGISKRMEEHNPIYVGTTSSAIVGEESSADVSASIAECCRNHRALGPTSSTSTRTSSKTSSQRG